MISVILQEKYAFVNCNKLSNDIDINRCMYVQLCLHYFASEKQCGGCNYSATPAVYSNHVQPCFVNTSVCTWVKKWMDWEKLLEDIKKWCNWPQGKSEERTLYEAARETWNAAKETWERALKAWRQGKKALNAAKRLRALRAFRHAKKAWRHAKAASEEAKKAWRLAKELAKKLCDKAKKLWNQLKKWMHLCSV